MEYIEELGYKAKSLSLISLSLIEGTVIRALLIELLFSPIV